MSHLLGGMLIFATLTHYLLQISYGNGHIMGRPQTKSKQMLWLFNIGLFIIFIQIGLGGWVSSNYAGLACIGFPRCNGLWLPHFNWQRDLIFGLRL